MVSEHGQSLSIRSVIPNIVGKVASFAFVADLVQEIPLVLLFNMALAAILDLKVKIVSKHNGYYSIRSVVPKLVGNDSLYAPLANLVQEISLFCFQYDVGGHFEKWAIKILSRHFWEVHGGLLFFKQVYLIKSIKKLRFR